MTSHKTRTVTTILLAATIALSTGSAAQAQTTETLSQLRSNELRALIILNNTRTNMIGNRTTLRYYQIERRGPKALILTYRRSLDRTINFLKNQDKKHTNSYAKSQKKWRESRKERQTRERLCRKANERSNQLCK